MKQIEDFFHLALKFCLTLLLPDLPFQEKVLPVIYNFQADPDLAERYGQIISIGFSNEDF
jgi:hypothetical protein